LSLHVAALDVFEDNVRASSWYTKRGIINFPALHVGNSTEDSQ